MLRQVPALDPQNCSPVLYCTLKSLRKTHKPLKMQQRVFKGLIYPASLLSDCPGHFHVLVLCACMAVYVILLDLH